MRRLHPVLHIDMMPESSLRRLPGGHLGDPCTTAAALESEASTEAPRTTTGISMGATTVDGALAYDQGCMRNQEALRLWRLRQSVRLLRQVNSH
jgi:hypothetical protein